MRQLLYCLVFLLLLSCNNSTNDRAALPAADTTEPYRPLAHFTPATAWMNDPNGMVFYNGTYHLFYQFYPDSTVWGPMHWGHATSTDLMTWRQQPIALYPDSLGYIFSGSAVVDSANTSGFGKDGKIPLVAIFTHHDPAGEKAATDTFQYQSLAYSLDEGTTWTKYAANPVLKNPGIRDFRDPKVMWYTAGKKWVMTLATKDRVTFYSSADLKAWKKESEFGATTGAHGGVWECPDLFPIVCEGKTVWVLLASINPGAPNGGSATQYFVGDFNGTTFSPYDTVTRWVDYGPDNYAGVTWSNTGNQRIFLGWMSNWQYATLVPTKTWRSAMTVPRELSLQKVGGNFLLWSMPVPQVAALASGATVLNNVSGRITIAPERAAFNGAAQLQLLAAGTNNFTITLSNSKEEKVVVGYEKAGNRYFIDRTRSGLTGFEKGFVGKHTAPRLLTKDTMALTLIIDKTSVELFADGGLTAMTAIFFPTEPFSTITIQTADGYTIQSLRYNPMQAAKN